MSYRCPMENPIHVRKKDPSHSQGLSLRAEPTTAVAVVPAADVPEAAVDVVTLGRWCFHETWIKPWHNLSGSFFSCLKVVIIQIWEAEIWIFWGFNHQILGLNHQILGRRPGLAGHRDDPNGYPLNGTLKKTKRMDSVTLWKPLSLSVMGAILVSRLKIIPVLVLGY